MLLRRLDIPLDDPDDMASALRSHIGDKLRITDRASGRATVPWVNPLGGAVGSHRLSGPDFVLRDVATVQGGVDLMAEDCGTGSRWRMHFIVPDSETNRTVFNEVCDGGVSAADARRDEWLRGVFS